MELRGRTFLLASGNSSLGADTAQKLANGGANIVVYLEGGEAGHDFRFMETDVTGEGRADMWRKKAPSSSLATCALETGSPKVARAPRTAKFLEMKPH